MAWAILAILAAFIWAIVNLTDKFIVTRWIKNPIVPVMISGILSLAVAGIIFIFKGIELLPLIPLILALTAGACYSVLNFFYFKAMKIEEASRVVPLMYLSTLFVLLFANLFLKETITIIQLAGVFCLVIGAILISVKNFKQFRISQAVWFLLLVAVCIAANQTLIKYALSYGDYWTVYSWVRIGTFISLIPTLILCYSLLKTTYREHGAKVILTITWSEGLAIIGGLVYTIAASTGLITLVNALSSVQPFFVLLIATILSIFIPKIMKEETKIHTIGLKFAAICITFIGILCIT